MVHKVFEQVLRFRRMPTRGGPIWLPIVDVDLIYGQGNRIVVPMIFDTGARTTILDASYAPFLGVTTWTEGELVDVDTAGGPESVQAYEFMACVEVFGRTFADCPVWLMRLPRNDFWRGLLGRQAIFEHFGFGFWESTGELLVTANP
jgi:hypothetical protein